MNVTLFQVDALESRVLLSTTVPAGALHLPPYTTAPASAPAQPQAFQMAADASELFPYPVSRVPILSSNPQAAVKIYLDFDGDFTRRWLGYRPMTTPAFDLDGNPASFNSAEVDAIHEIWARVAEAFSPFNVDVTTQDPGNRENLRSLSVVIGGDGRWYAGTGGIGGGVAPVGAFYNNQPNVVFVFSEQFDGDPKSIALVAIHEAGHGFGLAHQSVWSGSRLINEYSPGTRALAPFMGANYTAQRHRWWKGPSVLGPTRIQDDLAILAGARNGFGLRKDDHANGLAGATLLRFGAGPAGGIIHSISDRDTFRFKHPGGQIQITVSAAPLGAMLAARIELLNAAGATLRRVAGISSATFTLNLRAGNYFLRIASDGAYGSIGQYTIGVGRPGRAVG